MGRCSCRQRGGVIVARHKESRTGTTRYLGGLYERRTVAGADGAPGGAIDHVFYVSNGRRVVAQITQHVEAGVSGQRETAYLHDDHLGSTHSLSDSTGRRVGEPHVYEPFGSRSAWADPTRPYAGGATVPASFETDVGFTGHEPEDDLGLVNMGGRIYDPRELKFLTPDPLVQAPTFSQSHNRYAYAWNNPVNLRDPSGFASADDAGFSLGGCNWFFCFTLGGAYGSGPSVVQGPAQPPAGCGIACKAPVSGAPAPRPVPTTPPNQVNTARVATGPRHVSLDILGFKVNTYVSWSQETDDAGYLVHGHWYPTLSWAAIVDFKTWSLPSAADNRYPGETWLLDQGQPVTDSWFALPMQAANAFGWRFAAGVDHNAHVLFDEEASPGDKMNAGGKLALDATLLYGGARAAFKAGLEWLAAGGGESTVLSGHGALVVGEYSPVMRVPAGTSVTVWTEHGNTISDALGNAIETGGPINAQLYPEIDGARTYLPGSFMPDYTLFPPTKLRIMGSPVTVGSPTALSSLVRANMGRVQWAACVEVLCIP